MVVSSHCPILATRSEGPTVVVAREPLVHITVLNIIPTFQMKKLRSWKKITRPAGRWEELGFNLFVQLRSPRPFALPNATSPQSS